MNGALTLSVSRIHRSLVVDVFMTAGQIAGSKKQGISLGFSCSARSVRVIDRGSNHSMSYRLWGLSNFANLFPSKSLNVSNPFPAICCLSWNLQQ